MGFFSNAALRVIRDAISNDQRYQEAQRTGTPYVSAAAQRELDLRQMSEAAAQQAAAAQRLSGSSFGPSLPAFVTVAQQAPVAAPAAVQAPSPLLSAVRAPTTSVGTLPTSAGPSRQESLEALLQRIRGRAAPLSLPSASTTPTSLTSPVPLSGNFVAGPINTAPMYSNLFQQQPPLNSFSRQQQMPMGGIASLFGLMTRR